MRQLARISSDIVFYTQITMEAAEDDEFLLAMRSARIMGALVGVESITAEGLKSTYKSFNATGEDLVARLQRFRHFDIHVLGSFIFGLPSDAHEHFCGYGRTCGPRRIDVCAIPAAHTFPGHRRFRKMGKADNGRQRHH